jgi:hypothetical protein
MAERHPMPNLERILRHTDQSAGPDGCWPWTGSRDKWGYGISFLTRSDGTRKKMGAHRAVYQALHGEIPAALFVLHSCHRPPCCNPRHLRAGTHLENMADRQHEGAGYARGADMYAAVQLSPAQVAAIRDTYLPRVHTLDTLAAVYGVHRTTIHAIVRRKGRWASE